MIKLIFFVLATAILFPCTAVPAGDGPDSSILLPDNAAAATIIYEALLPAESGAGRIIVLMLFADRSFLLTEKYLERPPAGGFTSSGQWETLAQPSGVKLFMFDNFGHKQEMLFEAAGPDLIPLGQADSSKKILFKRR